MDAPWSKPDTLSIPNGMKRLSKEVLDFEKYIAPTKWETKKRQEAEDQVMRCVYNLFSDCTLEVFGSHVTGLTFPSSDIDFNINFDTHVNVKKILRTVNTAVTKGRAIPYRNVELIVQSKTPLIKIDLRNGVSVDITSQNSAPSSDRTKSWVEEFPELKPLFMTLKQAISAFRTNSYSFEPLSPKYAGLASFGLVCLIVSYLQLHKPADKSPEDPEYFAHLILGFLDHYSTFDASKNIICVTEGGKYYPIDKPTTLKSANYEKGKLFIINPDEPERNVCGALSHFEALKSIFKYAADALRSRIDQTDPCSVLSSIIKVEHHEHSVPRKELDEFKVEKIHLSDVITTKSYYHRGQKRNMEDNETRPPRYSYDRKRFKRDFQKDQDERSHKYYKFNSHTRF